MGATATKGARRRRGLLSLDGTAGQCDDQQHHATMSDQNPEHQQLEGMTMVRQKGTVEVVFKHDFHLVIIPTGSTTQKASATSYLQGKIRSISKSMRVRGRGGREMSKECFDDSWQQCITPFEGTLENRFGGRPNV